MQLLTQGMKYGIAVRDANELFLFSTIAHSSHGDVLVNLLHSQQCSDWARWKLHSSYHASGQHHQKSFDRKSLVFHRQRRGGNFRGTENVVTMSIGADEPRRLNKQCQSSDFDQMIQLQVGELTQRTQVSIDVAEPNAGPIITPGGESVQRRSAMDTHYGARNPLKFREGGSALLRHEIAHADQSLIGDGWTEISNRLPRGPTNQRPRSASKRPHEDARFRTGSGRKSDILKKPRHFAFVPFADIGPLPTRENLVTAAIPTIEAGGPSEIRNRPAWLSVQSEHAALAAW